jgi:polyhydroxyalkanoate synthesis regulator phasin
MQALTKDDIEKIGDQVKEVIDDVFQHMTQQQEEMNRNMQEQMDEFLHFLETTRIAPLQQVEDAQIASTT